MGTASLSLVGSARLPFSYYLIIHVVLTTEGNFDSLTGRSAAVINAFRQLSTEHIHVRHSTQTCEMFERVMSRFRFSISPVQVRE